jgi:hypothetical protein
MTERLKWIGLIVVIAVVALLIGNLASLRFDLGTFLGLKNQPAQASVVSSQTILSGIQPMGQLVSISAQVAKADIFVGVQQGALNACGFSVNHVAQGTVEAGIDLNKLSEGSISYDEATKTYTINLPAAQLTSCRVDYIDQYDTSTTACSTDWDAARQLAQYDAIQEFAKDSLDGGILDRAQKQAQLTLGNFIQMLHRASVGSDVTVKINFDKSNTSPIPSSCNPEPPPGWVYDATSNVWTKQ